MQMTVPLQKSKPIRDDAVLPHVIPKTANKSVDVEDSVSLFGKIVVSRMKVLDARKQLEAMNKILQVLYEIEYPVLPKRDC